MLARWKPQSAPLSIRVLTEVWRLPALQKVGIPLPRIPDDTFVDGLCEPAETFTFGGVFAHIMTFNAHRRLMALDALRHLGVQTEGFGDPMEYEESVAPWNQRVALTTP
jgi:hypothetical protein